MVAFFHTAQHARTHVAPLARKTPQLAQIAQRIDDFRSLIDAIEAAIDARGQIRDDASPALPALRAATRVIHDRLRDRMQRILDRAVGQGIAQESLITERDGRYVIPIKAESRSHLPAWSTMSRPAAPQCSWNRWRWWRWATLGARRSWRRNGRSSGSCDG